MSHANLWIGVALIGLSACAGHYTPQPIAIEPKRCTYISDFSFGRSVQPDVRLQECKRLANQGDAEAAVIVGDYYARSLKKDTREAIYWYSKAAKLGDRKALRKVFDAYYYGRDVPKNLAKAEEYLGKAFDSGADWAQLIIARRTEESDPDKALELYRLVARKDNCHAQARLALAYFNGDLADRNLTQAYFWLLLADTGGLHRTSDTHPLASLDNRFRSSPESCFSSTVPLIHHKTRLESSLPEEFVRRAQHAATNWRKGEEETILQPAPVSEIASPKMPSQRADLPKSSPMPLHPSRSVAEPKTSDPRLDDRLPPPAAATLPNWVPLASAAQLPSKNDSQAPEKLFELISRSVWALVAVRSKDDIRRANDIALGSAVAVTRTELLTNCHVIAGRPLVWIKQANMLERAEITAGDAQTDRCIIKVNKEILKPVRGIRKYEDLKIGEQVYSVGSPSGLESTLGEGIISGLRGIDSRRLIQTTAQISPGSSGGGLFDRSGNLLGITTFIVREGQGLNFAIAVEDFFR